MLRNIGYLRNHLKYIISGTALAVQWLRLHVQCSESGSSPGQGTRSHILQVRVPRDSACHNQDPAHSQNKHILKRKYITSVTMCIFAYPSQSLPSHRPNLWSKNQSTGNWILNVFIFNSNFLKFTPTSSYLLQECLQNEDHAIHMMSGTHWSTLPTQVDLSGTFLTGHAFTQEKSMSPPSTGQYQRRKRTSFCSHLLFPFISWSHSHTPQSALESPSCLIT